MDDSVHSLRKSLLSVVAGAEDTSTVLIACALTGGHLLIEDVPGVGKTLLAQAYAKLIDGKLNRVQGTPDLLPGDITGNVIPSLENNVMEFRPGPIFGNVVVFDELNRTSPRTQAALFEAAEERAVSIDGTTYPLPDPFMIIATQNPLDSAGTFRLGEGVVDRFAAVVSPGRTSFEDETMVVLGNRGRAQLADLTAVLTLDALRSLRDQVAAVDVSVKAAEYCVQLIRNTRTDSRVTLGASTRAGVSLMSLAKAAAWMSERSYVTSQDIASMAEAALAHRVVVSGAPGSIAAGREVVARCLASTPPPKV